MPRFEFAFESTWVTPLKLMGITPERAFVLVDAGELRVRFGPWRLRTPVSNVSGALVTGPYTPWKVIGPHLSLADRGVTFGTSTRRGVCVLFHRPVPALVPGRLLTHPGATLTVSDSEGLVETLRRSQST
ncbi:hypothetical protein ACFYSC_19350 [Streptosporangium sp. NPDC004379]|uniref:hypothetical protein n=1 Tax=Streptosporangium sp. NPDC004379 TaxID=3366189 RepID=UPI00368F3C63